jgi:transcriptional regulator with XRE-family HTH domain
MPTGGRGMTLRAIWLGQQLQALRTGAGLTLQQAGEYLARNPSSVSRFESGETPARIGDVIALMNLYGVREQRERDNLERLAREVWQTGWWEVPSRVSEMSSNFIEVAWVESRSSEIRSYDALLVPGMLQTREYAEAAIRGIGRDDDELIEQGVNFRMTRQAVLNRKPPVQFHAIIDEAALRRPAGSHAVMRRQLKHLIEASEREAVDLRVLPFAAGAHGGFQGPFQVLDQPYPFGQVGYAETQAGSIYVEGEDVEELAATYDHLREKSLDHHGSVQLIQELIKDFA